MGTDISGVSGYGLSSDSLSRAKARNEDNSSLSMSDFFTLLSAQMQNQSMYDSVDSGQYMAQMAQYTTLAQLQALSASFATAYAVSLVGKQVSLSAADELGNRVAVDGLVEGVAFEDGTPYLNVNGGYYKASDLQTVANAREVNG